MNMHFCLHSSPVHSAWFRCLVIGLAILGSACSLVAQDRRGPFVAPQRSVRSRDLDQLHVKLDLVFDFDKQQIQGTAAHKLKLFKPLREIQLDAADMQIVGAKIAPAIGKEPVAVKHEMRDQTLTLILPDEQPADVEFEVTIEYRIEKPRRGAHFVAGDEKEPEHPRMVWTQSEPDFARYWYPCFDSPNDRLTSEIIATVPKQYVTLSNGVLKEKKDRDSGTSTWHWVQARSHVPYLLSIVAGEFDRFEQKWEDIPVVSYVPRGRLAEAPRSFEKTPKMVEYFSRQLAVKYPWEKYAQICVDEYEWGGMEHTSATTLTLRTLHDERAHLDHNSDGLVAHELAHQWFGDLITCKDWGELWLNESFATYFATLWMEHDLGWDEASWDRRNDANEYMEEDKRYRRPIVTYRYPSPDSMFDRHTYPKGGRVLHNLRFVLGDEAFWKAMRRYTEINQHRTVETADLRRAVEDATGQGLNWFFDQWVHHGGHPQLQASWTWDDASKSAALTLKQTQKVDDLTPLFRLPLEIEIGHGSASQTRRIEMRKAEETYHFALDKRPTRIVVDPQDWTLKQLTCDKSKEEWLDQLQNSPHVIARAEAVAGLKQYNEHRDVVAAMTQAARHDKFWGVRQEAVKQLASRNEDSVRTALIETAKQDEKSSVRREALTALANFAHDDARQALREAIEKDRSYNAVAEAIKSLVKIDRDRCRPALLAALQSSSHEEVILRAACDGLAELKAGAEATDALAKELSKPLRPEQRVAILGALARLKADDPKYVAQLKLELDNRRNNVRRATINNLVALSDAQAINWLQDRRAKEETNGMRRAIDEAIEKLRTAQKPIGELQKEVDTLRNTNRALEERLKKLEETKN